MAAKVIFLFSYHDGPFQGEAAREGVRRFQGRGGTAAVPLNIGSSLILDQLESAVPLKINQRGYAQTFETSIMMYPCPEAVDMSRFHAASSQQVRTYELKGDRERVEAEERSAEWQ